MDENNIENHKTSWRERFHFEWILPVLLRPRKGLQTILEQEKPVWLTPLVLISALAILGVLIAGPLRVQDAQSGANLPPDFMYYSPEQQEQFMQAQQSSSSPLFSYVFPAVGVLVGIWAGWAILGGLLHLALTLSGSRSTSRTALNLAAWASLPFAARFALQALYMLIQRHLIYNPAFSGFAAEGTFWASLLGQVDLFLVWQIVLIFIGVVPMSQLAPRKAWLAAAAAILLTLLLGSLPGLLSGLFGNIGPIQSFYFF